MKKSESKAEAIMDSTVNSLPWDKITDELDADFVYKHNLDAAKIKFFANKKNSHYLIEAAFKSLKKTVPNEATLGRALQLTEALRAWANEVIRDMEKAEKELDEKLKRQ